MRKSIIRRINYIYLIYSIVTLATVLGIYFFRNRIPNVYIAFVFIAGVCLVTSFLINNYKQEVDKRYIELMVASGNIGLAKIERSSLLESFRDDSINKNKLFELEIAYYDTSLNKHEATITDLFSSIQKQVPNGYVYITYKDNSDSILIVPTFVMQKYENNAKIIETYESSIKDIKYLNVLYNKGLLIETFEDSLKRSNNI